MNKSAAPLASLRSLALTIPLLLVLQLAGCTAAPSIRVEVPTDDDLPKWYNAKELDAIGRAYAEENNLDFAFWRSEMEAWVPMDRDYLAKLRYRSGGSEARMLIMTVDIQGRVVDYEMVNAGR